MKQIKFTLLMIAMLGVLTCQQTEKKDNTTAIVGLVALQNQQKAATPSLSYSGVPANGLGLALNSAMTSLSPTASNFSATSYSVSPALPTGITLNTTTGVISGTPTVSVLTKTSYTITANGTSTTIKLLVGTLTSLTCEFKGTSGGCTTSIAYSCTNDTASCYRTNELCQASSFCY